MLLLCLLTNTYTYLASASSRKEQRAREIAEADGIEEGLVCVFNGNKSTDKYLRNQWIQAQIFLLIYTDAS